MGCPERWWRLLGDIKSCWDMVLSSLLSVPLLDMDKTTSKGPSQPQPFHHFVIPYPAANGGVGVDGVPFTSDKQAPRNPGICPALCFLGAEHFLCKVCANEANEAVALPSPRWHQPRLWVPLPPVCFLVPPAAFMQHLVHTRFCCSQIHAQASGTL